MRKPTVDQLREYAERIGFKDFDPEAFIAHYESNGWRVGKVIMISWRHAVVTWKKNAAKYGPRKSLSSNADKLKPRMTYKQRQNRINELNKRKADLIRAEAPYWKIHQIEMELAKL